MDLLEQKIISLIDNNKGDSHRLNEMLERYKSGKSLYNSDIDYIERLSPTTKPEIEGQKLTNSKTTISNNKSLITSKLSNVFRPYGISYNTRYIDEVKIHSNTCHHVKRASQTGTVKWTYAKSLKEALQIAANLYPKYGDFKFPRCCLYHGDSYFECADCKRYSDDNSNTHRHHSTITRIIGICSIIIPILLGVITSKLGMGINGYTILIFIGGTIILAIENSLAPIVCNNCLSKNWSRWTSVGH